MIQFKVTGSGECIGFYDGANFKRSEEEPKSQISAYVTPEYFKEKEAEDGQIRKEEVRVTRKGTSIQR